MQILTELVGGIVLLTLFGFGVRAAIRALNKRVNNE
jgi:hypothetical protein